MIFEAWVVFDTPNEESKRTGDKAEGLSLNNFRKILACLNVSKPIAILEIRIPPLCWDTPIDINKTIENIS